MVKVFKMGALFTNWDCTKYSICKITPIDEKGEPEEYFTYQDGIKHKFPGYELDSNSLVQNKTDENIDLSNHVAMLCQNATMYDDILKQKPFNRQPRFLSGTHPASISYTSYPRSGNTFLRKYLENITGVATGSDQLMKFTLNVALQYSGFKGEGIVKDKVWINKTHFPFRTPMDKEYNSEAVILAVRNPLDVFVSFFNMVASQTHTKTIAEDITDGRIGEYWDRFFESDVRMWVEWHDFWMDRIRASQVPVFLFRFEDLLLNPEPVLKDMFRFILAKESIDGTVIEQRIRETISGGKNFLYKPRSAGGGFHKHEKKLAPAQM